MRSQPLPEQSGCSGTQETDPSQHRYDSFSLCSTTPDSRHLPILLIDHLTSLPCRNLFLRLGRLKGPCQTSVPQPLQADPFSHWYAWFLKLSWASVRLQRKDNSLLQCTAASQKLLSAAHHGMQSFQSTCRQTQDFFTTCLLGAWLPSECSTLKTGNWLTHSGCWKQPFADSQYLQHMHLLDMTGSKNRCQLHPIW